MQKKDFRNPYILINLILAGIIILIFVYSGIFSPTESNHPIPSNITMLTGENTTSTGLSRAFSSMVRLQFEEARNYNQNSIRIFSFFMIQLLMRLGFIPLYKRVRMKNTFIVTDSIISLSLFIAAFFEFIAAMYRIPLAG